MRKAIELISGKVSNITEAPVYTSKAVGYTDQPDFLNTALRGETELSPFELLVFVKDIEKEVAAYSPLPLGSARDRYRYYLLWRPKTRDPDLTIPHPRCIERDFVLRPNL